MKYLLFYTFCLLQQPEIRWMRSTDIAASQYKVADEAKAQTWLVNSINRYFKADVSAHYERKIFTKQYLEYKTDAISREYDGLSEAQFSKKWSNRYNTKLANTGSIIIGQPDWVKPRITRCSLKSKSGNAFLFNVVIEDSDTEEKYIHHRDIKVSRAGNTFMIADVLEYDN